MSVRGYVRDDELIVLLLTLLHLFSPAAVAKGLVAVMAAAVAGEEMVCTVRVAVTTNRRHLLTGDHRHHRHRTRPMLRLLLLH